MSENLSRYGVYAKDLSYLIEQMMMKETGGLRSGQTFILHLLSTHGGRMEQKEILNFCCLRKSTISINLSSLEQAGYIQSLTREDDKRIKIVSLTPLGVEANNRCERGINNTENLLTNDQSIADLKIFQKVITKMIDNLKGSLSK